MAARKAKEDGHREEGASKPQKVVIVGGGCAALTTAFDLTSGKNAGKFDVTVYTMGWRLGGKGASGRNENKSFRIEEHGLHVWMGFYENAFRIIRECYDELAKNDAKEGTTRRFRSWTDAFFPEPTIGTVRENRDGSWGSWRASFPPTVGLPGDPLEQSDNPFTLWSYLTRAIELTRAILFSVQTGFEKRSEEAAGKRSPADIELDAFQLEFTDLSPALLIGKITKLLRMGTLATSAGMLQALLIIEIYLKRRQNLARFAPKIVDVMEAIVVNLRRQFEDVSNLDPELRQKTHLIDLTLTIMYGLIKDGVFSNPSGLDSLNKYDCRQWLEMHGATRSSIDSPIVQALYSIAFADLADGERGQLAAGQAIRGALRMFFTYRGSLVWKMRGGMGDVVFAPLYLVLSKREVKFKFFHKLERVSIDTGATGTRITSLRFSRQLPGVSEDKIDNYNPLVSVTLKRGEQGKYLCWPSEPVWDQLDGATRVSAESLEDSTQTSAEAADDFLTLADGNAFDFVVLAVDVETIKSTCLPILKKYPRWRDMVKNVKTGTTQAFQLWLTDDLKGQGWDGSPITMSGMPARFDAFSQMNHLIPEEGWGDGGPHSVLYFCGVMDERKVKNDMPQVDADKLVSADALHYLSHDFRTFLSGASPRGKRPSFPWETIHAPKETRNAVGGPNDRRKALVAAQFVRANHRGSHRYVLSRPGTLRFRISPLDVEIQNMTIAGDWTDCGFNEGCVEAAVMSGRLASHALSQYPPLEDIVGYDHP